MKDTIKNRIEELKSEYANGVKALEDLNRRQDELRNNLLRISGAIQVLEELEQANFPEPAA